MNFYSFILTVFDFLIGLFDDIYNFLINDHEVLFLGTFTGFEMIGAIGITAIVVCAIVGIII